MHDIRIPSGVGCTSFKLRQHVRVELIALHRLPRAIVSNVHTG